MARTKTKALRKAAGTCRRRVRIAEDCLEVHATTSRETTLLRSWVGRVNGATYPQPYLVEGPPGHFRLYVGAAAERVRTAQGIR